jgi:DNA helicase II / ATP-dependent DNA helicase PcrA
MKNYIIKNQKLDKKKFLIDYKKELNSSQYEAVITINGPLLVIAGAGSGKTRTLVYRAARLIESGIDPANILLLTFTRKAAKVMLDRASNILDKRCQKINGGTFHSFANSVLRKYGNHIGLSKNFTILDRSDSEDLINLIRTRLGYAGKDIRFPKKSSILDIISKAQNKSVKIDKVVDSEYPQYSKLKQDIKKIKQEYNKYKSDKMLLDYDDLLIYFMNLLEKNQELRIKLSNKYRYIMIDEFQDTNKIQAKIGGLLASEHHNIMAVGDDSQSIYSFRGAYFKNIMSFPKIYKDAKIVTLEQNYRSSQQILDFTNGIIEQAKEKFTKNLFSDNKSGGKPVFIEAYNENQQSAFITQKTLELREEGVPLNEVAVLFRSSWHSNDLEIELAKHSIPFAKFGGFKFIETAHVKDILAYLRIIFNESDTISWLRVLLLIEGVGPKKAADVADHIHGSEKGINDQVLEEIIKSSFPQGVKKLMALLKKAKQQTMGPAELISVFIDYYFPLMKNKYDDYNKRKSDIDSFTRIAERYQNLEKFLSDLTLEPLNISQSGADPEDLEDEKMTLSTIHSAKGLEWHSVFIIFANDGFLPSLKSLNNIDDIEEERRLLYVAATRAKENLFVIKPNLEFSGRNYFDDTYWGLSKISRFLDVNDILERFTEKWTISDDNDKNGEGEYDEEYIEYFD